MKADRIVESVRAKMLARSEAGQAEHGATMEREDLTRLDWLVHTQAEMMDAAVYLEKLIQMKAAEWDAAWKAELEAEIERHAETAILNEREFCARLCDQAEDMTTNERTAETARVLACRIRARGNG